MARPLIVAITGASGAIYGVTLLRALRAADQSAHLIMSESAVRTLTTETDIGVDAVKALADHVYNSKDIGAAIASGSFRTAGMVIAPCSMKTLSAVAHSYSANLIARAADVVLKERRRLVMMVRETPLHKGHLELMAKCFDMGATIFPPMPAFYHRPATIDDIVAQTIGRVLDQFDIETTTVDRWTGQKKPPISEHLS